MSQVNVVHMYRHILRSVKFYPSIRRDGMIDAVKEEFRANKNLTGEKLERALWLGVMEEKRLQRWMTTRDPKDPRKQKSDGEIVLDL